MQFSRFRCGVGPFGLRERPVPQLQVIHSPADTEGGSGPEVSESSRPVVDAGSKHLFGLDGLRALAAVLVVVLHAGVPYCHHRMPGLAWPTFDRPHGLVDVCFWTIELFVMPLFLCVSGFLMHRSIASRGANAAFRSRCKRLLRPLAFGMLVILPIELYVWVDGWVIDGLVPLRKLRSFKFDDGLDADLWGTSHLWYLVYVWTFAAMCWIAFSERLAKGRSRIFEAISKRIGRQDVPMNAPTPHPEHAAVKFAEPTTQGGCESQRVAHLPISLDRKTCVLFGVACVAALAVAIQPRVVWGFQHDFAPVPTKWMFCAAFFVLGLVWSRRSTEFATTGPQRIRLAGLSVCFLAAALTLGVHHLGTPDDAMTPMLSRVTLACLTAAAAVTTVRCVLAWCLSRQKPFGVVVGHLSAASLWIYLVHHPLVGLMHIDAKALWPEASGWMKFVGVSGCGLAVSLLSYRVVAPTRLGNWLGVGLPRSTSSAARKNSEGGCATTSLDRSDRATRGVADDATHDVTVERPIRRAA